MLYQKRPDPQLRSPFGDAIVKKGPAIEYTKGPSLGSENRGGDSSAGKDFTVKSTDKD